MNTVTILQHGKEILSFSGCYDSLTAGVMEQVQSEVTHMHRRGKMETGYFDVELRSPDNALLDSTTEVC